MGNLYTHLLPHHDTRIEIKTKLKYLWHQLHSETSPKNKRKYRKDIRTLQRALALFEPPMKPIPLEQKYGGSFAWKARELGLQ